VQQKSTIPQVAEMAFKAARAHKERSDIAEAAVTLKTKKKNETPVHAFIRWLREIGWNPHVLLQNEAGQSIIDTLYLPLVAKVDTNQEAKMTLHVLFSQVNQSTAAEYIAIDARKLITKTKGGKQSEILSATVNTHRLILLRFCDKLGLTDKFTETITPLCHDWSGNPFNSKAVEDAFKGASKRKTKAGEAARK